MKKIKPLHSKNKPLIIGNAWDPMSALIMEQQGYKVIGTTSWGIANALGYNDGERISFETYIEVIKNMLKVLTVPLSVDIESGFATGTEEIVGNVVELAKMGCSGINIEDSSTSYQLKKSDEFSNLIKNLRSELDKFGFENFFINARIDTYISLKEKQLKETIKRAKLYEDSGADGIFVPLLSLKDDISALLKEITVPLNIMSLPNLTDIEKLGSLGVRRVSFGNAMSDHVISEIEKLSKSILVTNNTQSLYQHEALTTKFKLRMNTRDLYDSLVDRESMYLGKYYASVRSTGIFCDMTCPCKKSKYKNTSFYNNISICLARGHRECKVCHPTLSRIMSVNPKLLDQDLKTYFLWLETEKFPHKSYLEHPIGDIERLQKAKKIFKCAMNMSLGKYVRIKRAGFILRTDKQNDPSQQEISFEYLNTPLGEMIACIADEKIYLLEFIDRKSLETELMKLKVNLNGYFIQKITTCFELLKTQMREYFTQQRYCFDVPVGYLGTEFQKEVWNELTLIPYGSVISYGEQAKKINKASAVRAVANANGKNMISIIVPCHRVIASDGGFGGYGGGIERKKQLLSMEKYNSSH